MQEEVHLFILWENSQYRKDEIMKDISESFEILRIYKVTWSKEKFSENLSRFYGTNLPDGSYKEQHCGTGPFLLIIVKSNNNKYEIRSTSKGDKVVNALMFDKKTYYRDLTGGGHKVHATNDIVEVNHDLTLLLGKSTNDFLKEHPSDWDGNIIEIEQDLFGAYKWNSPSEMFYALNNTTRYALLRNYENLPEDIYLNDHNDIDLICDSTVDCAYVLNAKKVFQEDYRVHYVTKVEDRNAFFDLRFLSDNYYCKELEEKLLEDRVFNEKGFYTINNKYYFYTLLYHAVLHKKSFAEDYKKRLITMNNEINFDSNSKLDECLNILQKWLIQNEYYVTIPEDRTVLFNYENAGKLSKLVYRNEQVIKELKNNINSLNEKFENLKSANDILNNDYNKKIQEINNIYNSRSWRSTKIFRSISKFIKNRW